MREIMLKDTIERLPEVLLSLRKDLSEREAEAKKIAQKLQFNEVANLKTVVGQLLVQINKKMLKYLFDEKYIDAEEHSLVNVTKSDFKLLAEKTGKTSASCYRRWQQFVLPILKTHTKGLPLERNWEWQERLMSYIIKEKANALKDLNFSQNC